MSTDEYVPSDEQVESAYIEFQSEPSSYFTDDNLLTRAEAQARWSRWLAAHDARVRRDAWDACYRQMVTAPARGVTVTEKSNPYAPERRVAP